MNIDIDFSKYPQYKFAEWKNKQVFNLSRKGFLQGKRACIEQSILEFKEENKILSLMVFFRKTVVDNPSNTINLFKRKYEHQIENVWNTFFHYKYTNNSYPLSQAIYELLYDEDNTLMLSLYWEKCEKTENTLEYLYNEENIRQYFSNCKYVFISREKVGEIVYPDNFDKYFIKFKQIVSPTISLAQTLLENTYKSVKNYAIKELFPEEKVLKLEDYSILTEDKKIYFASEFIKKHCVYKESQSLITSLNDLYKLKNKSKIEDALINYQYSQLLDKYIPDFLGYVDIYKNKKSDVLKEHIIIFKSYIDKIYTHYQEEIEREIKVRGRYFNNKT